jgi:hypothetical protein
MADEVLLLFDKVGDFLAALLDSEVPPSTDRERRRVYTPPVAGEFGVCPCPCRVADGVLPLSMPSRLAFDVLFGTT